MSEECTHEVTEWGSCVACGEVPCDEDYEREVLEEALNSVPSSLRSRKEHNHE